MKRETDSTDTGFFANLRKNISELIAPSATQTPASAEQNAEQSTAISGDNAPHEAPVNKVGKKIFELKVSDAAAIRPQLPESFIYPDAADAAHLHAELLRELPPDHPLAGVPLETFAACESNDDVLFRFRGNPRRFVLVHLTWLGRTEIDAHHPGVVFDGTFEEFLEREK